MQKNIKELSKLVTLFLFLFTYSLVAQNKFVGVKSCGTCHKKAKTGNQLKIWKKSSHANAYKTLKTKKADKIALEKGFETKAVDTPECLGCHTIGYGYDIDKSMFKKKFKIEDGVQCESCHGAGSKYKKKKIMKDHVKAVANGLKEYEDIGKELCKTCHNKKSPTFKEFDFEERWKEIEHPIPTKG